MLTGSGELVEESSADLSGDFSLRGQAGDYSLLALAPGYLPQVVAVSLPHDGRLHGFRVHLRAIRVETLSLYEAFLMPYWPQGSPWGELTPREAQRELLRRVRREQLLLREMTTLVESAYFSGEHPTAETLERIRELAKTVATAMEGRPA